MLDYVKNNLVAQETLIYLGRRSIVDYANSLGFGLVFLGMAGFGVHRIGLNPYSGVAFIVAIGCGVRSWLLWKSTEFGITSKRLIYKNGIFSVDTWEMQLSKANKLSLYQSLPGRMLNFGTITISDSGNDSCAFINMDNPAEFRQHYLSATDQQPEQKARNSKNT